MLGFARASDVLTVLPQQSKANPLTGQFGWENVECFRVLPIILNENPVASPMVRQHHVKAEMSVLRSVFV